MAQKRSTKLRANPANTLEAAAMEFALTADEVNALVGKKADVMLKTGKVEADVEILRFVTGRDKRLIKLVETKSENNSKAKRVSAIKLYEMKVDDKIYRSIFIPSLRAAILEDTQKRNEAVENKLGSSGNLLWEEYSPEDQIKFVEEHKKSLREVGQHFRALKMNFYETKYFLFYTNISAKQVAPYLVQLDKMNELLGKAFGFKPGHNIWRGKAVIVAFTTEAAFLEFERKFYNRTEAPGKFMGLCHSHGDGKVIVSCYQGDDPDFFGALLVHETSHGYMHRYRSTAHIPSWFNEGIADWVAMMVVPSCKETQRRQKESVRQLRKSQSFGGLFFSSEQIENWQYGSASAIVQLMVKASPEQFKLFFNGIKDGLTWQDSLLRSYGITAQQLCTIYGQSIGVPFLTP